MSRRSRSSWEQRWQRLEEARKRERDPYWRSRIEQMQDNIAEERKEARG